MVRVSEGSSYRESTVLKRRTEREKSLGFQIIGKFGKFESSQPFENYTQQCEYKATVEN